uniref:Uncharacterized protein n=1 Tax=Meloidogyne hapla TaxID=6305 RepID=A0A1I8B8Z0_MELHA
MFSLNGTYSNSSEETINKIEKLRQRSSGLSHKIAKMQIDTNSYTKKLKINEGDDYDSEGSVNSPLPAGTGSTNQIEDEARKN